VSELTLLKRLFDISLFRKLFALLNVNQILLYFRSIDFVTRYSSIVNAIDNDSQIVLDVGAGKIGIGAFINNKQVVSLDVSRKVATALGERVVASASSLPFRDLCISTVISVDCIEHLPKLMREQFFNEAKRVAKTVVIHTPVKAYCCETDWKFARTHKRLFGQYDMDHLEHITFGQPTIRELEEQFPDCIMVGNQNRTVNYILFVLQRIPVFGWLTGVFYFLFLKRLHNQPPYYAVTLKWAS